MVRRLRILVAASGLLGLSLVMAPGVAAGDPCYHGYTIPPATSAATSTVHAEPCAFVPTTANVEVGTTVSFVNVSQGAHLVTGANASWGDRDDELLAGATRTVRFDRPGTYAYSCALHRGMTGVIVVTDRAAGAAAVASPPASSTDGGQLLAMSGLAGFAVLGWALAIIQRRRATASPEPLVPPVAEKLV
jgi:plastocyanin